MATFDEFGMIKTIDETDEIPIDDDSSDEDDGPVSKKKRKENKKKTLFSTSFSFEDTFDPCVSTLKPYTIKAKGQSSISALDDKIAERRLANKKANASTADTAEAMEVDLSGEDDDSSEDEAAAKTDLIKDRGQNRKGKRKRGEDPEEQAKIEFSESVDTYDEKIVFQDMNLSRPLLKGLASMNFVKPTPIQAACIPVGLMGRDVCACAVTGSGKTVAFMLPIMERLLYRPRATASTRVLILLPTRELAVQVHTVARKLGQHCNIDVCMAVGGLDLKSQEAALRLGPDIVIATPGRLIDHLHNSMSFTLHNIEILVLDEADRMLDEYFAEQMKEIINMCARQRQTMLFSATMTEAVQDLIAVSLKDPVKVFMNTGREVALGLRQEFIRIRPNREGDREAIVAALVSRNFCERCIVFVQTKVQAHRMHILLGLLGVNVGELHGNLSQAQRLDSLKKFKEGLLDVMLATDLASRGLDIEGVKTVINFTMPSTIKHYIHRVGRTARAGKSGRSVSLVGENERKVLKEVVKEAKTPLKSRMIPPEVISKYCSKIAELEEDIKTISHQEREEAKLRGIENQMNKAQRLLEAKAAGEPEPMKRTWFQTHKERKMEKEALRLTDHSNKSEEEYNKDKKRSRKKITAEDRVKFEITKAELMGIRAAKKSMKAKPAKPMFESDDKSSKKKKKKKNVKGLSKSNGFEEQLADIGVASVKKARAGPSYKERKEATGSGKKALQQMKSRQKNHKKS